MADHGEVVAPGTVRFERILAGTVEEAWAWLTEPEKRKLWFAGGTMEPRAGGRIAFLHKHSELSSEPGLAPEKYREMDAKGANSTGTVLRWEPPRLLSFAWDEDGGEPSEVTIELTPAGDQVRLVLTHSRLTSRAEMVNVSGGWHTHLKVLEERAAGREPGNFWKLFEGIEEEYQRRLPA